MQIWDLFISFLHPNKIDDLLRRELSNASWSIIIRNLIIAAMFPSFLALVIGLPFIMNEYSQGADYGDFSKVMLGTVVIFIQSLVSYTFFAWLIFFIGKRVGGKARYLDYLHCYTFSSLVIYSISSPLLIIFLFLQVFFPSGLLAVVPAVILGSWVAIVPPTILGVIISAFLYHIPFLIALPLYLYFLFINYKILRNVHGLSRLKALIVMFFFTIFVFALTLFIVPKFYLVGRTI